MANHLMHLLAQWYPRRDEGDWVLGTVYKTRGPCYRKAGAMMLFNNLGEQFGMLSGGCLESDIQRHARRVMQSGDTVTLCYDSTDEDDLAFQLGIGCGGTVHIMLQPLTIESNYLQLDRVYCQLKQRQCGTYYQGIPEKGFRHNLDNNFVPHPSPSELAIPLTADALYRCRNTRRGSVLARHACLPAPAPVGGRWRPGCRPLVSLAHELGWQVTVWDPRPASGRREFFLNADSIINGPPASLHAFAVEKRVDAAVLMTHSISLDSQALTTLNSIPLSYWALLGPPNRRADVLNSAGLTLADLRQPLSGPAGLDIGADLPETIALSILAECHAAMKNRTAGSLSGILVT